MLLSFSNCKQAALGCQLCGAGSISRQTATPLCWMSYCKVADRQFYSSHAQFKTITVSHVVLKELSSPLPNKSGRTRRLRSWNRRILYKAAKKVVCR